MPPLRGGCVRPSRFAPERDTCHLKRGNHWTIESNNPFGWLNVLIPPHLSKRKSPGTLHGALERKASGVGLGVLPFTRATHLRR